MRVTAAYADSLFDVMCCSLDLPEDYRDAVVYQDVDQVCIPRELYCGELASLVSRKLVSLDECLGDSFRVRNVSDQIHDAEMKKDMYVLKSVERDLGER